jgi:hypothetical protein
VPVNYTAKGVLTPDLLVCHFRGQRTEHVIGLHTTAPDNTSRWGAVDVDAHGDSGNDPAANLAAALAWHARLRGVGLVPLLTSSNGAGGYHLRVLFGAPVPTPHVYGLMRWLVTDHAECGLPLPETFPKQPQIAPGRYGNWLRLPGRHHTREHWSHVWDGGGWLDGADAVAFLLALRGADPGLIPADARSVRLRAPSPAAPLGRVPYSPVATPAADQLDPRIRAYLKKLPVGLGEGQHRDDYGFRFAAFLVRDLNLSDAEALPWMQEWDSRNAIPKGTDRLGELLKSARAYGHRAYGSALQRPAPIRPLRDKHSLEHIRFTVEV